MHAETDLARALIESLPIPLALTDSALTLLATNNAFRARTGEACAAGQSLRARLPELERTASFAFEYRAGTAKSLYGHGWTLEAGAAPFLLLTLDEAEGDPMRAQQELRTLAGRLFTSQEDLCSRSARGLHDEVCQKLAMLQIETEQIESRIIEEPEMVLADIDRIRNAIIALADTVRRISRELYPSVVEDLGIAAGLRALTEEFRNGHISVSFTAGDLPNDLPQFVASGLYRIAHEALRNAATHAGETHVQVTLTIDDQGLHLTIQDYGCGFEPSARRGGSGIVAMKERARMIEGAFAIESKRGEGTCVSVSVPVAAGA